MSFSPLAYADSLRIGSIDFVSPDEIKVLLDIEAPDNLAMNTGTPRPFPRINGYVLVPIGALWFSSIPCSNSAYSFKTPARNCGPGLDGLSARCHSLSAKKAQVPRRHHRTPHTIWLVQLFFRSTIDGPMAQNERSGMRCRLLGAMRNKEIMKFLARH